MDWTGDYKKPRRILVTGVMNLTDSQKQSMYPKFEKLLDNLLSQIKHKAGYMLHANSTQGIDCLTERYCFIKDIAFNRKFFAEGVDSLVRNVHGVILFYDPNCYYCRDVLEKAELYKTKLKIIRRK